MAIGMVWVGIEASLFIFSLDLCSLLLFIFKHFTVALVFIVKLCNERRLNNTNLCLLLRYEI